MRTLVDTYKLWETFMTFHVKSHRNLRGTLEKLDRFLSDFSAKSPKIT